MNDSEMFDGKERPSDVLPWAVTVAVFLMYLVIAIAVFVAG